MIAQLEAIRSRGTGARLVLAAVICTVALVAAACSDPQTLSPATPITASTRAAATPTASPTPTNARPTPPDCPTSPDTCRGRTSRRGAASPTECGPVSRGDGG